MLVGLFVYYRTRLDYLFHVAELYCSWALFDIKLRVEEYFDQFGYFLRHDRYLIIYYSN